MLPSVEDTNKGRDGAMLPETVCEQYGKVPELYTVHGGFAAKHGDAANGTNSLLESPRTPANQENFPSQAANPNQ